MFWITLLTLVVGGIMTAGPVIVFELWRDRRKWARRYEEQFVTRRLDAIINLKRLLGELEGALWPATIEASRMEVPMPEETVEGKILETRAGKALADFTRCLATDGLLLGAALEGACQRLAGAVQAYRRRFARTKDSDGSVSEGLERSLPKLLDDVNKEMEQALPGCALQPLPAGAFISERLAGSTRASDAMIAVARRESA